MITFKKKKDRRYNAFSRGTKKFKRFEGNHLSMSKGMGPCYLSWTTGNMRRFLLSNVGRPVDKVFSKYLERCEPSVYDAKKRFFSYIEEKKDVFYRGGFYVTNGILNYSRKHKSQIPEPNPEHIIYNRKNMPSNKEIMKLCMKSRSIKDLVFLGKFYVKKSGGKTRLAGVYISPAQSKFHKIHHGNITILGYGNGVSLVSRWYDLKRIIKLEFDNFWKYYWADDTFEFIIL